jgi:flagellar protein FlbD
VITVTRLDNTNLVVNAELLEFVEATPDTVLTMTTGRKVIVRESPHDVIQAVIAYKRRIHGGPESPKES